MAGFPDDGLALDQLVNAADQQLLDYRRRTRGGDPGLAPRRSGCSAPILVPLGAPEETIASDVVDLTEAEAAAASQATERLVHRIAEMPWPEQDIEERLTSSPTSSVARVTDEGGSLHVGVLVRPTTDRDLLPTPSLTGIQLAAGAVPEVIDLRVMPLGSTAETRLVRPAGGVGVTTAPPPPAPTTTATAGSIATPGVSAPA